MATIAVEHLCSESFTGITSYNTSKWCGGSLIKKRTDFTPNIIAPILPNVARNVEQPVAIPGITPHVISWSDRYDYIFLADNAAVAVTRRVVAYRFDRETGQYSWLGYITLTYPTATNHAIRSLRVTYDLHTVGTVSSAGTTITGSGTRFLLDRPCVGNRIGFGSTDPKQITTWYTIATISADGTLTTTIAPPSLPGGTAYVIEDLRVITVNTNATAANGGVYVTKGLSFDIFTVGGTTIPAAVSTDNIRAVYWLADAATVLNTITAGSDVESKVDFVTQYLYVLDVPSATSARVFKYNIRKALTLTTGKDTTTLVLTTGTQTVITSTVQTSACQIGTLNHGPANGQIAMYFVTTTRIYCALLSNITNGNVTWINYTMSEVPPGGSSTYTLSSTLASIDVSQTLDRLILFNSGAAGARSYVTKFNNSGDPMDKIFLCDDKQVHQTTSDGSIAIHPATHTLPINGYSVNGILYYITVGTTAVQNFLYNVPIGCDWDFVTTTNQRLITPKFLTPNCNKLKRVYTLRDRYVGSSGFEKPTDPFKIYYRTSGIDDNTGAWNLINEDSSLTGAGSSTEIQFAYEFKIISDFCIPGKIIGTCVTYDDISTDSHYQPSANFSNITSKTFAWRFSSTFGGIVPTLRIRLYDAILGVLLLDDNSTTPSGTWGKSTNGGSSWGVYDTTDKTNETTYIRYTPASLGDNITIRAILTLQ